MVNVAINGFGRIGRLVFRIGFTEEDINFVAINDLTDAETLGHLLKHDSVHGTFPHEVKVVDDCLEVDGKKIKILSEKDPKNLPWKDLDVDIVVESTGIFNKEEDLQNHLNCGAKKALLSAPGKGGDIKTIVLGVNENEAGDLKILSNASCTTNSLAPLVKALDQTLGVESGFMSTIHAYTNDQRLLDLPHKDIRRGRAAPVNIIPTTTGAAKAVGKVLPHLEGKMDGVSYRVPVPCGSITDFTCVVKKETTAEEVNAIVKKAAESELKGVLEYSEAPLVSTDIIGNCHSSIFDSKMTKAQGRLVKVATWYDNEYGFSCRMVDMLKLMSKTKNSSFFFSFMYTIKQIPEDFVVKEISDYSTEKSGAFAYFLLKKTNHNTMHAIKLIAQELGISEKNIGCAGNKDKNAVTEQVISIKNGKKSDADCVAIGGVDLEYLGNGTEELFLGKLKGNEFAITIRNISDKEIQKITEKSKQKEILIPNYFGPQRFSKQNHIIGKHLLKKEFKEAAESILETNADQEVAMKAHLEKSPNDYVVAIKKIPLRMLKLYVHAYQSFLFNECVKEAAAKQLQTKKIPLIGFGTESENEEIETLCEEILEKENITQRDFIIPQIPELSMEGDLRNAFLSVTDFEILEEADDELNKGKKKVTVSFSLPKGAYATVVVDQVML